MAGVMGGSIRAQLGLEAERRGRELRISKARRVQQTRRDQLEHGDGACDLSGGDAADCPEEGGC